MWRRRISNRYKLCSSEPLSHAIHPAAEVQRASEHLSCFRRCSSRAELRPASGRDNSRTASLVALLCSRANACRKHLQPFYGTSSNLQARTPIITCCCGNPALFVNISLIFFWRGGGWMTETPRQSLWLLLALL